MKDKAFQDLAKSALEVMKTKTVIELMKHDVSYQESLKKHEQAEKRYTMNAHIFTPEQKEIVEEYFDAVTVNNADMNDLLYMAGLKDMLCLLASYDLIKVKIE